MEYMVFYIDPDTGQTYVEVGDRVYEMEIGDDVTEEMSCKVGELEPMRVFDPADTEKSPDSLRIESFFGGVIGFTKEE